MEVGPEPALSLASVAFPPLDDLTIFILQRVRRPAALHRRLSVRQARVEVGGEGVGRGQLALDGRSVEVPLAVLEHEGLFGLVEHACQSRLAASSRSTAATARSSVACWSAERPTAKCYVYTPDASTVYSPCMLHLDASAICESAAAVRDFPAGPVPAADLVGREAYIRRATARLADGNHILIAGPRRIGKTSVMLEILRRLRRKGLYTAYVDCMGATDIRGLGERLADAILENVSGVSRTFEQAKAVAAGLRPTAKVRYEHVEVALGARAGEERAALLRGRARSPARARREERQARGRRV